MSQIGELVKALRNNHAHRQALAQAQTHEELVRIFIEIADSEGIYVEEAVIEAAVLAAQMEGTENTK